MVQIQFFLIKKKIGRPEHSLPSTPQRPITSQFCLTPSPSPHPPNLQSRRQMCIAPSTSNCAVCLLSPRNFLMLGGLDISKYYLGRTSNCQELHTRVQDSKK